MQVQATAATAGTSRRRASGLLNSAAATAADADTMAAICTAATAIKLEQRYSYGSSEGGDDISTSDDGGGSSRQSDYDDMMGGPSLDDESAGRQYRQGSRQYKPKGHARKRQHADQCDDQCVMAVSDRPGQQPRKKQRKGTGGTRRYKDVAERSRVRWVWD